MEWSELRKEIKDLKSNSDLTPTAVASAGSELIYRVLSEMYIGEPDPLRKIALAISESRPSIVALRNVSVAVVRTAQEARVGDRMAAAGRAASRLKRIIDKTPKELGRRGQPLIENNSNVAIFSYSLAVGYATDIGKDKISSLIKIPSKSFNNIEQQVSSIQEEKIREVHLEDIDFGIEKTDCVLLGCTAFLADGSIVAESGTKELVERCFESNIKVHFFADTLKLAPWLPKENSNEEFLDIIPGQYVDHVITEDGIRRPDQLLDAAADLAPMWEKLRTGDS